MKHPTSCTDGMSPQAFQGVVLLQFPYFNTLTTTPKNSQQLAASESFAVNKPRILCCQKLCLTHLHAWCPNFWASQKIPKSGRPQCSLKTGQPSAKLMVQAWFTMFTLRLYSHEEWAPEFPRSFWSVSLSSDLRRAEANWSSSSSESSVSSSGLPPWGWKNLHLSPLEALGRKVLDKLFVLSKYMQVLLVHRQSDQSHIKKNQPHKKGKRKVLLDLVIARCCIGGAHSTVLWCTCPAENASKAAAAAAKHLALWQLLVVQKVIGKKREIDGIHPKILPNSNGGWRSGSVAPGV